MSKEITLKEVVNTHLATLSDLEINQLANLKQEALANLEKAKRLKDWLDMAIALKYQDISSNIRNIEFKPTGTINFKDNGYKISATISKKVSWDQKKLKDAISHIKNIGDNPYNYVEVNYKVLENRFKNLPEFFQDIFKPARTVNVAKEIFKVEEIANEEVEND